MSSLPGTRHRVFQADARDMSDIEDASTHLIVTSPPYWQLKDYGTSTSDGQIGFFDTYDEYINNLNLVWHECNRVLHPGCRMCINIGDQFARAIYYGRYKVIPIRTEIIRFCETIGLDYMGAIIWQKVTTTNTTGGASVMGSFPYPRNGIIKIDYEFILIFKKLGKPPEVTPEQKKQSKLTTKEWNTYFYGHWNFSGEKQDNHLAAFPVELPRRLIRMFSFVGETVLDPFLGSGTTTIAANIFGRNSIGYEISKDYVERIKKRFEQEMDADLFQTVLQIEYLVSSKQHGNLTQLKKRLPYQFQSPSSLSLKVDPRKLVFGSKIGENMKVDLKPDLQASRATRLT